MKASIRPMSSSTGCPLASSTGVPASGLADPSARTGLHLIAWHGLVQHRVAEAIDRVGELGGDRRIEVDVDVAEQVDGRRDLARELLEHQMLILRFGAELGRPGTGARRSIRRP